MATSVWAKQGGMWGSPWKALLLCSSPGNQEENLLYPLAIVSADRKESKGSSPRNTPKVLEAGVVSM